MLADFVEYISRQAVNAAGSRILQETVEPDHIYLLQGPDGKVERHEAAPAPRQHKASGLAAVCEFAGNNDGKSCIWYSRIGVVCLMDDSNRRDRVSLPLTLSPQIDSLLFIEKTRPWLSHKELINLLKITFADCLGPAGELLSIVKNIRFKSGSEVDSQLAPHGRSLGSKIEAQVTGPHSLPDEVAFSVPIFLGAVESWQTVTLAFDSDAATQKFQLVPLPRSIERAITFAERQIETEIAEGLDGTEVPVYYGCP